MKEIMRDTMMTTKEKMEMAVCLLVMTIGIPLELLLPLLQKWNALSGKMIVIRNSAEMVELYVMVALVGLFGGHAFYSLLNCIEYLIKNIVALNKMLKKEKWLI